MILLAIYLLSLSTECGKPILDRTHAHLYNERFDTVLFAHASFHIPAVELYTALNIKENNWDFYYD